jgi:hypothetical protein
MNAMVSDTHSNALRAQRGGSALGLILTLAVFGYGAYVAIQYVPLHIEWVTANEVLEKVIEANNKRQIDGAQSVWTVIDRQLYINERGDLKESFNVGPGSSGGLAVNVHYQRSLNLLFTQKPIVRDKTIQLR